MSTGPHKPNTPGAYHEVPGRRSASRIKTEPDMSHPQAHSASPTAPAPAVTLAQVAEAVLELRKAVSGLGLAITGADSDVAMPKDPGGPAPATTAPSPPLPATKPASDPALTQAERRVKILGSGIGVLIALSSALSAALGLAWSYIKGYGDDRAARAIEIEESRVSRDQIDDHEARLAAVVSEQKTLVETIGSVQLELVDLRRYRELHRLEAEHLNAVNDAIAHRRKPPGKPLALQEAEAAVGISATPK